MTLTFFILNTPKLRFLFRLTKTKLIWSKTEFVLGLFTSKGGRGWGGGGGGGGGAQIHLFAPKSGFCPIFMCARGLHSSKVMYKPIIEF